MTRLLGRYQVPGCCPGTRAGCKPGLDCSGGGSMGARARKRQEAREVAMEIAEAGREESEPDYAEALAAFEAAEPAEVVRPPRAILIEYRCDDDGWHATSPQIDGLFADGPVLAEVQRTVCKRLAEWLDPAVNVTFRIVP